MKNKAVFNWSGGKDSALALHKVLNEQEYEVIALLTTINRDSRRSTMHAIPESLLQKQADSIGIPLYIVDLTPQGNMSDYESEMQKAVSYFKELGVNHFIFGDIFLHDVKSYREKQLKPYGITVVEPLWDKGPAGIMDEFLASGLKTVIVTTMADILDSFFIGRHVDKDLISELPTDMDICGENGEYHTFCYDGDIFSYSVPYSLGRPEKKTYLFTLDDGTIKEYSYWFANLNDLT
ncbi:uncharacterized protein (TIGR00290 family) [Dysgonomonas hofstadii]|uniref:Uncharacterized protein (TIGR00290 family) n=1 Tax=Dysgonomonas hofstadii TaxID=637886 RepID=A0A840CMW2_9BACT|nr:diphthine--ammonia ligase [Dysgonomonas hofstadii]MBB4036736.1 uncharacterized protein (TIGR00290 family) [Dysgonomonas hofstadii]